ncbi:MAG: hypothetical protein QXS37_05445 [Candidatus Aenigmatarchaeota archaeon]
MEAKDIGIVVGVVLLIVIALLGFSGVLAGINIAEITSGPSCNMPPIVCQIGTTIGIPSNWLTYEKFIWYALLPITGIWLIIYGFLSEIKIFSDTRINAVLSLVIAFSTIPMGVFVIIVAVMFGLMGMYATLAFFTLFILGVFYLSGAKIRGWKRAWRTYDIAIERTEKEIGHLQKERLKNQKEIEKIEKEMKEGKISKEEGTRLIEELNRKITEIDKRIVGLQEEIKMFKERKKEAKKELEYI